jgi:hypothetical protein
MVQQEDEARNKIKALEHERRIKDSTQVLSRACMHACARTHEQKQQIQQEQEQEQNPRAGSCMPIQEPDAYVHTRTHANSDLVHSFALCHSMTAAIRYLCVHSATVLQSS